MLDCESSCDAIQPLRCATALPNSPNTHNVGKVMLALLHGAFPHSIEHPRKISPHIYCCRWLTRLWTALLRTALSDHHTVTVLLSRSSRCRSLRRCWTARLRTACSQLQWTRMWLCWPWPLPQWMTGTHSGPSYRRLDVVFTVIRVVLVVDRLRSRRNARIGGPRTACPEPAPGTPGLVFPWS